MTTIQKSAPRIIIELTENIQRLYDKKHFYVLKNAFSQWKTTIETDKAAEIGGGISMFEDTQALHSVTTLTKTIEEIMDRIAPEEYTTLHHAIHDTIEYITRLEQEHQYLSNTHVSLPPLPATSYQPLEHTSTTAGEIKILQEYHEKLLLQIHSLEKQLSFVKHQKEKSDQTHNDNTQRLIKQLHTLSALLQKAKEERDHYHQEVVEKERALEVTLVHLTTTQEEIKKISTCSITIENC